jgi:hypothetical protein
MAVLGETKSGLSFSPSSTSDKYYRTILATPHSNTSTIAYWGGNVGNITLNKIPTSKNKTFWRGTNTDNLW